MRLAVSHLPDRPSAAHSPDDMGTRQFRQLPVFIGSVVAGCRSCLASAIIEIDAVDTIHILVIDILADTRQDSPSQVILIQIH